jgi:hypothetical protein
LRLLGYLQVFLTASIAMFFLITLHIGWYLPNNSEISSCLC